MNFNFFSHTRCLCVTYNSPNNQKILIYHPCNDSEAKSEFCNIVLLSLLQCLIENVRVVFCSQFNSTIKLTTPQGIIRGGGEGADKSFEEMRTEQIVFEMQISQTRLKVNVEQPEIHT